MNEFVFTKNHSGIITEHNDALVINIYKCHNKQDLLKQYSKVMNFPNYFGYNWDALYDCLLDLDWIEQVYIIHNEPIELSEGDRKTYLEVLISTVLEYRKFDTHKIMVFLDSKDKEEFETLIEIED